MPIGINNNNIPRFGTNKPGGAGAVKGGFQRLSTGFRINKASDDAAGLAISENLKSLIRGLSQAERNTSRAVSLTNVKEGGLDQVGQITSRMRELATQAADGALNETNRGFIDEEFQQLKLELDRTTGATEFNDQALLNGPVQNIDIQVGTGTDASDTISVEVGGMDATSLGLDQLSLGGADGSAAKASMSSIDSAMQQINQARAENGAIQNRLGAAKDNTAQRRVSVAEANSRIRDADFAEETSRLAGNQVLQRARVSVAAQANQSKSLALNLLK